MPEASDASFRDHLQRLIECAVCMDTATDPRRLPCGHSFCLVCMEELFKNSSSASRVKCPNCREDHFIGYKGPRSLPKDFIITQLSDMVESDSVHEDKSGRCDFCPKTFSKTDIFHYCFDCDCICCIECRPKHRCQKGQTAILKKMDFQYSMICERHPHPVRFICQTCTNRLCKKCERQGTCDGHEIFDIFGGIQLNDQSPTIAKYTLKKSGKKKSPKPSKKDKQTEEDEQVFTRKRSLTRSSIRSSTRSSTRSSIGEISVNSATFYTEVHDVIPSPTQSINTSTIREEPVVEITDTIEQDANPQPWSTSVDIKVRAVTMLPNGYVVALTESSVLTFTNHGTEVSVKGSKVKLEDAQHIVYWEYRDSLVVTERMAKRMSLLKLDGTKCYRQVKVKNKRPGLFSCGSSQSSDIKDFGPNHIAVTPAKGFVVTTATTTKDAINPGYDVLIYNDRCKVQHRWQCDLPPLSVTCDKDSLLYFPQWHTVLVYQLDGTKLYQFGDKKTLFQPLCIAPLSEEHHLLVAHRKSYIGDDYSVWRVSKWRSEYASETESKSKRRGHLVESREGTDGPIVDINVTKDLLVVAMEKKIQCTPIEDLRLKLF